MTAEENSVNANVNPFIGDKQLSNVMRLSGRITRFSTSLSPLEWITTLWKRWPRLETMKTQSTSPFFHGPNLGYPNEDQCLCWQIAEHLIGSSSWEPFQLYGHRKVHEKPRKLEHDYPSNPKVYYENISTITPDRAFVVSNAALTLVGITDLSRGPRWAGYHCHVYKQASDPTKFHSFECGRDTEGRTPLFEVWRTQIF